MKKQRIIFNYVNIQDTSAGTGTYAKNLLKGIQQYQPELLNEITVLLNKNSKKWIEEITDLGYDIKIINTPNNRSMTNLFSFIIPIFFKKNSKIYFSPLAIPPLLPFRNWKVITTIHDTIALKPSSKYKGLRRLLIELSFRLAVELSDEIVTVSPNSKSDLMDFLKVCKNQIHVIPNFILQESSNKNFEKVSTPKNKYFLFVGNVQPGKNLLNLIRAFSEFSNKYSVFDLVIVGNNSNQYYDILIQEIKTLQLEDKIHFKGFVPDTTPYYLNAHAFVFPSFYEGFGIPVIEALKNNCTLICSNTSSLPWVAGPTAIYLDPYSVSSIEKALIQSLDGEKVNKLKVFYKQQISKFSSDKIINDFVSLINN